MKDWNNIDLNSHEVESNIVDSYSFSTLLLEVECNCKEIDKKSIEKQFLESLNSNIESAKVVFYANLDNVLNESLKRRNLDEK
jgi:hypothetical protein